MKKSIAKILIIILVLAGTFGALIYWGAKSYQESAVSIQSIVKPDNKSFLTNSILKTIFESDLHLNNFILTNSSLQRELSREYALKADSLILELEQLVEDVPVQQLQLDSLKEIIQEKSRINRILIDLKKRQNSQFFTEQALNKIKSQLSDSAYIDKSVTQKQDLIIKSDTIEQVDVVKKPDDYKGFSGFFRKLFGKEKVQFDTITSQKEQLNYSLEITENSKVIRDYFVDTTVMMVKAILIDVLDEEIQLQRKLYSTEMEIINYNELLLNKIRDLLDDISTTNESTLQTEQKDAIQKIELAQREAFLIAGAGVLLGFILLIFLIKDIFQTIIYRRKLEEEKERAEQLAAAKESFLSSMSHEIRTPLHSISGFTGLLENEISDGKQKRFLSGISQANRYLYQLIGNILEQAKINAGTYKLELSKVYIPELCRELEMLFLHKQTEKENVLKVSYSELLKQYQIDMDKTKLKQVLVNLLENAFKFTSKGTIRLQFQLSESANDLEITIADSGTGIDPKYHESIFYPFNQIAGNHEMNVNGAGLGLSISKHIIESFGGSIRVDSELEKGSVFTIHLPVSCELYIEEDTESRNDLLTDVFYPIKVLAVEDDEWNAYLLENYLAASVPELKICPTAEDALAVFNQDPGHYDLILTDLNLPQMDGRAFFKAVTSVRAVPVFVLSASISKKDREELMELGFSDTIGKPFSKENILRALSKFFVGEYRSHLQEKGQKDDFRIEWEGLLGFLPEDVHLRNEQLAVFVSSFESKVKDLQQAIVDQDTIELGRLAHQLKSNCEQVGIHELSERLQSIEVFAITGNQQRTGEEAESVLPQLLQILQKLKALPLN